MLHVIAEVTRDVVFLGCLIVSGFQRLVGKLKQAVNSLEECGLIVGPVVTASA
jgi:hypothetical protein